MSVFLLSHLLLAYSRSLHFNPLAAISSPGAGDKHDYFTPAPYYWPDPKNPRGPYVVIDGQRVPGTGLYDEQVWVGGREPAESDTCEWRLPPRLEAPFGDVSYKEVRASTNAYALTHGQPLWRAFPTATSVNEDCNRD